MEEEEDKKSSCVDGGVEVWRRGEREGKLEREGEDGWARVKEGSRDMKRQRKRGRVSGERCTGNPIPRIINLHSQERI